MKSKAFQDQFPDFFCNYDSQEQLAKTAMKDDLLLLLSQFLTTHIGKLAAASTVGLKTFKDMYTKRTSKGQSDKDKSKSQVYQQPP